MKKPIVLLDCDGVLADFAGRFLHSLWEITGVRHLEEAWDTYNPAEALGLSKDVEQEVWRRVRSEGWCESLEVLPGAQDAVKRLRKFADVLCLTSPVPRSQFWMPERERWLAKRFKLRHEEWGFMKAKEHVRGDVFVEDHPETLHTWRRRWGVGHHAFLWPRHSNVNQRRGFRVASGWDEVVEQAEKVAEHLSR